MKATPRNPGLGKLGLSGAIQEIKIDTEKMLKGTQAWAMFSGRSDCFCIFCAVSHRQSNSNAGQKRAKTKVFIGGSTGTNSSAEETGAPAAQQGK